MESIPLQSSYKVLRTAIQKRLDLKFIRHSSYSTQLCFFYLYMPLHHSSVAALSLPTKHTPWGNIVPSRRLRNSKTLGALGRLFLLGCIRGIFFHTHLANSSNGSITALKRRLLRLPHQLFSDRTLHRHQAIPPLLYTSVLSACFDVCLPRNHIPPLIP